MALMFGRFEVQSEISKSETASIYKAFDQKTNQTVALKTQSLEPLGDRAATFVATLVAEGERARNLATQNVVALYGAGEIEGQFCAAMEYIQGNSIATMLARKEGFSIWDLLDITRQVCAALGHADTAGVVHSSLEPAKIMVQWDGLVKIAGYGISNMSLIGAETGNGLGALMPYCSPEQIRGEAMDQRSNLFTLGAILYEMVVGHKAFAASDPVVLVGQIENEMPADPASMNVKMQPGVSAVIMKALAKDPAARYQTARELVEDLELCKEGGKKTAAEPKKTSPATAVKIDPAARAAAAAKFTSAVASASEKPPVARAQAAAAAQGAAPQKTQAPAVASSQSMPREAVPEASGARLMENLEESVDHNYSHGPSPTPDSTPSAVLSAAVEQEQEAETPRIAVDPMMAGGASSAPSTSFSDIDELPPLKEPVFMPPSAPQPAEPSQAEVQPMYFRATEKKEEKPRVQPREVAEKAINQIVTIPPRLMLFSILAAVTVIAVVAMVVFLHVHNEDDGSTAASHPVKAVSVPAVAQPAPAQPVPAPPEETQPEVNVRKAERHAMVKIERRPITPAQPVVVPGQAFVDSTPEGVPFQLDGKSDPSWVTPFNLTGLNPGKHVILMNKSGYSTEIRSLDVVSNGKSSLMIHLAPINALVVVNSTPAGAEITLDGHVTGRVTPAQFAVEKGSHTVALKKQGYLDETTSANLEPGQNFQYAPVLRALGNADDIRTVGKLNKLFGRGGESTAGMGTVSVHTQPKGAQVALNQRMLDKLSPVDIMVGPGNYVVDITLTGFKPIHKVISVEKGDKIAISEILERE